MASEMILANLLNQEGGILSKNWYYSTELRVFCLQPFYRIGLLLKPHDWYVARIIGQALCLLATIASYLYMGHQLGLRYNGLLSAIAFACPFGTWYLMYGIYGGYYLPHMLLLTLCFGVSLALRKATSNKRKLWLSFCLMVLCLVSGMNGVKSIMALFVPLLLASVVVFAYTLHTEEKHDGMIRYPLIALGSFLVGATGYVINSKILTKQYHFPDFTSWVWAPIKLTSILDALSDFAGIFGYQTDSGWKSMPEVFSLRGILGLMGLVMAAAVVFATVRLFKRWDKLKFEARILLLTFVFCVAFQSFILQEHAIGLHVCHWPLRSSKWKLTQKISDIQYLARLLLSDSFFA